ncbi:MAG TPA: L,D-transpeptidase [Thermomicrobiales bacterium]|nr:L,D-transpeptidase [Thermomicrobiales bacterium]
MGIAFTTAKSGTRSFAPWRWLLMTLAALVLLGGAGWMSPEDARAGQAATVVVDGAPLFAEHNDHTVIDWMAGGTRVDFFYGPYKGLYEIRYYGTVGWTWVENVVLGGQVAPGSGGGSGGSGSPGGERWIDVDRSNGAVRLYEGNTVLYTFWGSLSRSQGEDFYATATGTYYVYTKHLPLVYTPYADNYFTHWVGFDPERRNGFHSYVKYADGSLHPNGGGYTAGCVAIPPGDIDILYNFAYMGMRVVVHW